MKFLPFVSVFVFIFNGFNIVIGSIHDCPLGWEQYGTRCHRFVFYPPSTFKEATKSCETDGAHLVALNGRGENLFLIDWLNKHEKNKANKWWTGGRYKNGEITWSGDGPFLSASVSFWRGGKVPIAGQVSKTIVYAYDAVASSFRWDLDSQDNKNPYICEIQLSEAYRITQQQRDFTFGSDIIDPNLLPKGPKFIQQPESITIVGNVKHISLECEVTSLPLASYKWHQDLGKNKLIDINDSQDRYTITNGRLTIHEPSENLDTRSFRCTATNEMGSVLSEPAGLNFGFLMGFSNDGGGTVLATLYRGFYLSCDAPMHNPAVSINWYKDIGEAMFLRTDLQAAQYISTNGNLYFSEVTNLNAGVYHCVATLVASGGEKLSTRQNPSRTSLGIELIVQGGSPSDYGPAIHQDFPFVNPSPPLRGGLIILECFAFGKPPLFYSWTKDGGSIPKKAKLMDHSRKLVLPDGQLEDSGSYTCRVTRRNKASSTKTFYLQVQAAPFFLTPMRDKHVDIGDNFMLLCNAHGLPEPTYTWYKNAKPLSPSNAQGITIQRDRLLISKANKENHDGMYQCEARNRYGLSMSTAQVRVLAFAPSFAKNPLDNYVGSLGGSVTILCQPEASPKPEIDWFKDDYQLSLAEDPFSRVHELPNGNLLIRELQMSDEGSYSCMATNEFGSATSKGHLMLIEKINLFIAPLDDRVGVNGTVFLPCQASYNAKFEDLVYVWDLNGKMVDVNHDAHFSSRVRDNTTGLYVINAQLNHTGIYTCRATTVYGNAARSAFLQVEGPPAECSGVVGKVDGRNVILTWVVGAGHGSKVKRFDIQLRTNFVKEWRTVMENVDYFKIFDAKDTSRCHLTVGDLRPGSSYSFRVIAMNGYGVSPPSWPSMMFKIADAAPTAAVQHLMEGSGSVGLLPIIWEELNAEELTGAAIGYRIFYRKKSGSQSRWSVREVKGRANSFTAVVGADNYYLEYEVMVAAFNDLGSGPNSTIHVLMSTEDVPVGTPTNVFGDTVNATAMMVYWDPIPNTRAFIRGNVIGYQANYWSQSLDDPEVGSTPFYCDDCGEGMVVGLTMNDDYWITVNVFTGGGNGPYSESGEGGTSIFAPLTYPEFVAVSSHPGNSVHVHWKGVTTGLLEETLIGYKLRYWPASDDIRTASDVMVYDKRTYGVIEGLEKGVVYALRVNGFSAGGDGKKSPTVFFTLEGQVVINPETTAIMNTAGMIHDNLNILKTMLNSWMIFILMNLIQ